MYNYEIHKGKHMETLWKWIFPFTANLTIIKAVENNGLPGWAVSGL